MSDTSNRPELPQSSAGKIRSLCDELARHYRLDDTTRDELRGHLEDKLAAYLSGEQRISEEDALLLVRAHFGDAAQVARRLKRESTASSFWSAHIDPARLYSIV